MRGLSNIPAPQGSAGCYREQESQALAHHEPILDGTRTNSTLKDDLALLHDILKSISPVTAKWLDTHTWVRLLVRKDLASYAKLERHTMTISVS